MPATVRHMALLPALALLLPSCSRPGPAHLAVDAVEPARAVPLVFHGSCHAGWGVSVDLRIRETGDATVWMDGLDFTIVDAGRRRAVADESLDAAAIRERYGDVQVPAGRSVLLTVFGVSTDRPVGPLAVDGAVDGRDEHGNRVSTSFHLTTIMLDVHDPEPDPSGGACGPPPAGPAGT